MKEFYVDKLSLEFVSEQRDRHVFLKTDKNMLLIFNPEVTSIRVKESVHGAMTPPSMINMALEVEPEDYEKAKEVLEENNIQVEKEITWENDIKSKSIYFRDPAGNLVEFITRRHWPVLD